ncbi:MAG: metallophosphoesterase, partial [Nanoarchaeota archaeon]|nr:metallophosphoesterase [Nanoarchaeota archaeon]
LSYLNWNMKIKKEIIALGDIEIGGGTLTDDFIGDKALSQLIDRQTRKKHPVDLILNGDTFDFLKCPFVHDGRITYPRYVTPEISASKLELMYQAHSRVFAALRKFVCKKQNNLYFIIGNHDYDLVYGSVQRNLRKMLHCKENVHVRFNYHQHQVYAEHGHQYDLLNKINYKLMFLKYKGKTILNLPWATLGLIGKYMHIKEEHPFIERIQPRPTLFSRNRQIARTITRSTMKYFFLSIFYYPIRYFFDPTYSFPKKLFWNVFRRIRNLRWEPESVADVFKLKSKHTIEKNKILLFGHIHDLFVEQKEKYILLHSGCWRDEYQLDSKSDKLTPKTKYYVKIEIVEGQDPLWQVLPYPIKRSTFRFTSIMKDEMKYIRKAAQEEGYQLRF